MKKINNTRGFTIIEVLIVLAIAGLIMLVVFLAVPALQRNARNTAIKTDASAVAGGIAEFQSNNEGALVTAVNGVGTVKISSGLATTTATTAKVQGSTSVTTVTTVPVALNAGLVEVLIGQKCDTSPSTRATSIYYALENSSTIPQVKCLES